MSLVPTTIELFYSGVWNDITDYVRVGSGIRIKRGNSDEVSNLEPSTLSLTLNNIDGRFTPSNPRSPLYGLIGRNSQIRITTSGSVRFVGEVAAWPQRWDVSGKDVYVPLEAAGIARRLGSANRLIRSPLRRYFQDVISYNRVNTATYTQSLRAYWPMEDASGSVKADNVAGPVFVGLTNYSSADESAVYYTLNTPSFGGMSDVPPGSAPLPTWDQPPTADLTQGTQGGYIPPALAPWAVHVVFNCSTNTDTTLAQWFTNGTFPYWQLYVASSTGELTTKNLTSSVGAPTGDTYNFVGRDFRDGLWHHAVIFAQDLGGNTFITYVVDGVTLGSFTSSTARTTGAILQVSPRPRNSDSAGMGHVAVYGSLTIGSGDDYPHLNPAAPMNGYLAEMARARISRLAAENNIYIEPDLSSGVLRDISAWFLTNISGGFDVTVTGERWAYGDFTSGMAVSQSGGVGIIAKTDASSALRFNNMVLPEVETEEVYARVNTTANATSPAGDEMRGSIIIRHTPAEYIFIEAIRSGTGTLRIVRQYRNSVNSTEVLGSVTVPGITGSSATLTIRIAAVGKTIQAKAWIGTEPTDWQLTVTDKNPKSGSVGLRGYKFSATTANVTFDDFELSVSRSSTRLGPQPIATLLEAFNGAASADLGVLAESRDQVGIRYISLSSYFNQSPVLTLAYSTKAIAPPFEPTEDDAFLANEVTVTREGGSSATVRQTTGPLSTLDPPNGVGVYDKSYTLNLAFDTQAINHAGWLLRQGTWETDRFKTLTFNMRADAFVKDSLLKSKVLALDVGELITVTGLPSWIGPEDAKLLIRGYEESVSGDSHIITFSCTPHGYHFVGHRYPGSSPDQPTRRSAESCITVGSFTAGVGTSLTVNTQLGPLWTTDAGDLPFDILVAGVRLRVTAIGAPSGTQQVFTVTAAPINGVTKVIAGGSPVALYRPCVRSL